MGGNLSDCEIRDSALSGAKFEGVLMHGADFSHTDLSSSTFYLVLALGAKFSGANSQNAQFRGGGFQEADFKDADLRGATFADDNMGGAIDLRGADFSRAKLADATFQSAWYDASTIFPADFNPVANGLTLRQA